MQWDFGDMCGALITVLSSYKIILMFLIAAYGCRIFKAVNDHVAVTNKLRRVGFDKMHVDSDEMFLRKLDDLAALKVIPNYRAKA